MIPWLAKPHQTEPKILEWAQNYPQQTRLNTVRPWTHTVYALTVTDSSVPDDDKRKCLFAVPHGHEPAGTVACMNVLSQLLDGCALDGTPTTLDRKTILRKTLLTFIPDANPEGRSRAPEDWWDGSRYSNDEFLKFAFGIDSQTGERFKRVDRWRTTADQPSRVGIAYERIDETTYVEPNRDGDSSFFRLIHRLTERHRYDQFLDLHQTEFECSPHNCVILLPVVWDDLPEPIRAYSQTWADEITAAWRPMENVNPQPPRALGYTGQQRAYFEQRWGALYRAYPHLTVEVQNNNSHTPADLQRQLSEAAIWVSIERLMVTECRESLTIDH
jgi:hypothetical protein